MGKICKPRLLRARQFLDADIPELHQQHTPFAVVPLWMKL